MVKGLYQGSGSMQYLIDKTDVIGNNLANASTNGFKTKGVFIRELIGAEQALENDQIHSRINDKGEHFTRQKRSGCYPGGQPWSPEGEVSTYTNYINGPLRATGNPLDLALSGEGYFAVNTPEGTAYTRDGQFKLDSNGYLVTANGDKVQGEGGPIQITGGSVSVSSTGEISSDGVVVNRLSLRTFDSEQLVQIQDGLYTLPEDVSATEAKPSVQQGYLEGSNVNIVHEMVEMISAQRHYDANARLIQSIDSSLQKSVNDIGRV